MANFKFLVLFCLVFTCSYLANSAPFSNAPGRQTEKVNLNVETKAKKPEGYYGGGYGVDRCRFGCCYWGGYECSRCCRYPNEKTNSVKRPNRSRSQVAEKAKKQEVSPVLAAHGQP